MSIVRDNSMSKYIKSNHSKVQANQTNKIQITQSIRSRPRYLSNSMSVSLWRNQRTKLIKPENPETCNKINKLLDKTRNTF